MSDSKAKRQSNFELLRIFAIVLIIIHHIFVHVIRVQLQDTSMYGAGEMFNNFIFYRRLILLEYAASFGKIATNLFVIISGYFLCCKPKRSIIPITTKLLSQLLYITFVIVGASCLYFGIINDSFVGMQPLSLFNNGFWFIGYYYLIIVIGNYFLNGFLDKLSKEQYFSFLLVGFAIVSFSFSRGVFDGISVNLSTLLTGILFYALGGFLRKYNPFNKVKSVWIIVFIIISYGIIALSYRNYVLADINLQRRVTDVYHQSFVLYTEYSVVIIFLSICIFELFSRMKIKNNVVVNYIASSTFIIYMLHDNIFTRQLWLLMDWIKPYYNNIAKFMFMITVNVITVIAIGTVIYTVYYLIDTLLKKLITK